MLSTPSAKASNYDQPNQYGYHHNNLDVYCGCFTKEFSDIYPKGCLTGCLKSESEPNKLPNKLKILTWNVWGMIKRNDKRYIFLIELMMLRAKEIVDCIIRADPDVIVLQEMSHEMIGMLKTFMRQAGILDRYAGYGHNFTELVTREMEGIVGRDLDTYVFSKYTPQNITQYCLNGNLNYTSGVTCIDFGDVCVVGCYLQAGSKNSFGQETVYHHYARCRCEQIGAINRIINENYADKVVILCGDFNTNLDGDINDSDSPEAKSLSDLQMQDTYRTIYPDKIANPGFTEDTDVNHMRWNMKYMEKKYRYDGIFLKNHASSSVGIAESIIIGTDAISMDEDMFRDFMRLMGNKNAEGVPRSHTYHPSDHFGVMTTFDCINSF